MMDASRIPSELQPLVRLLDDWAISDDMDRSLKIENADKEELKALVAAVDAVDSSALYEWLAGPEASSSTPSPAYLAMTCLTMAADEARVTLQQRT